MNEYIQRCTALVVLIVAGVSLFFPVAGIWVQTSWINYLLMIVMFGMGLTMKVGDFVSVFTSPKEVVIGFVGQFAFMPLLAYLIGTFFGFGPELMAGLVLVGTCPGGTASDVMTYLAKGDVALSVSITAVNTLLAPILTPLLTLAYLGTTMNVRCVWDVPLYRASGHRADSSRTLDWKVIRESSGNRLERDAHRISRSDLPHYYGGRFSQCAADLRNRHINPCCLHPSQSAGLCGRLSFGNHREIFACTKESTFFRDRHAELGIGDHACRHRIS